MGGKKRGTKRGPGPWTNNEQGWAACPKGKCRIATARCQRWYCETNVFYTKQKREQTGTSGKQATYNNNTEKTQETLNWIIRFSTELIELTSSISGFKVGWCARINGSACARTHARNLTGYSRGWVRSCHLLPRFATKTTNVMYSSKACTDRKFDLPLESWIKQKEGNHGTHTHAHTFAQTQTHMHTHATRIQTHTI